MLRLASLTVACLLAGCTALAPHTFKPAYQSRAAQVCIEGCWQDGVGCSAKPYNRCWWNDQCMARCDPVEQAAVAEAKKPVPNKR